MANPVRVFIHGLESSGKGTKGTFFSEHYPDMIVEDYHGPLRARMTKLKEVLSERENLIIVGSSFGGLMASIFACDNRNKVNKLILLAPALELQEFNSCRKERLNIPVVVYHGSKDDVVPINPVREIASEIFANLEYNIIDDNHSIEKNFKLLDWNRLLCYE
ncbi:MAG: alpha/beta hydrolase [Syntrophales bacterium]|nr:alpha/beta hydrolase [Syntrophales bacterium]MDY0044009.1 YqiA/YcfP family alpha/beta fold hydrolase [Syntrophales bacterium]